jgi:hypothetical protein
MIKLDEDLHYTINVAVLRAIDNAISDVIGQRRVWITDEMLPEFLPILDRLVERAVNVKR